MLNFLLDLIFPRFCVGCQKMGKYFCDDCRKEIRFYLPTKRNQKFFALAHYDGIIRQAIHDIKYRGHFAIIKELVPLFSKLPFTFDYLVPVPLSHKRLHEREFNQSLILAKELGKKWGIKVLDCLKRTRDTKPQFDLAEKERFKNIKHAFAVKHNSYHIIHNSVCCLVDDVSTTGATLRECAKALRQAGAKRVCAVVIAKG